MGERSISERLARMPPGRHLLPADLVAENQRARILLATTQLVAEHGYSRLTIEAIAKTARVALTTFYDNFADKEECFLAAFDESVALAAEAIGAAVDPALPWPERLAGGLEAFLELVMAEPTRARACLLGPQAAGAAGLAHYHAMLERVADQLSEGRELAPEAAVLPEGLELAAAGGLAWLVQQRLARGETDDLMALLPEMLLATLTLYLGAQEAARVVAELRERGDRASGASGPG